MNRFRRRGLAVFIHTALVWTTLCAAPVWLAESATANLAQPATPGNEPPQVGQTLLSGKVELARLLDLAAQRLRLNIDYDAAAVKGDATLRLVGGVTDQELWALVNRLLASRGLTTVRAAGDATFSVVKLADAAGLARVERERAEVGPGPGAGFQTVAIRVSHRPAKDVIEAIKGVLSKSGGSAVEVGAGGMVVVSDLAPRLEQILRIVEAIDLPSGRTVIETFTPRHVEPAPLAPLVMQMAAKREAVSGERVPGEVVAAPTGEALLLIAPEERLQYWRDLVERLDQPEPVHTVTYTTQGFSASDVKKIIEDLGRDDRAGRTPDQRTRVLADAQTGTLIVTATPGLHKKVAELIVGLERIPPGSRHPVRHFKLRNRSVSEMIGVLSTLMDAGLLGPGRPAGSSLDAPRRDAPGGAAVPGDAAASLQGNTGPAPWPPRSGAAGGDSAAGAASGKQPAERTSGEAARERPLLLAADPGTNTLIVVGEPRLVAQVEALIKTLDVRQPQVMLEVLLVSLSDSQSLSLGVELQKQLDLTDNTRASLSSLFGLSTAAADATRVVGDAAGFTGLVLNPGDFSVVLRALETINHGRSLSVPKILVNNNQQGVFNSTLQQPFSSTNASNTATTTSFGGTQDAGTVASIRPQIAEGDHLILEYNISLSSFVGGSPGQGLPPPRQQNSIQSVVTIPDGYTVIVGGLEVVSDAKATTQVPFLASVPVLGDLFKNRNNSMNRSRFYVFMRANVLRQTQFEDLKYLSQSEANAAAIDDEWPMVEPRVIR